MRKPIRSLALVLVTLVALALPLTFAACSGDDDPPAVDPVPVTDVSLNPAAMDLAVGGQGKSLAAAVLPANATNKGVTWSSEPAGIVSIAGTGATVTVGPVAAGTATITVTTQDGGKTATCDVTVTGGSGNVTVTGVSVIPATLSLVAGGPTGSLTASLAPANATNQGVTWSSDATGVATVQVSGLGATVTPVSAGKATITVIASDTTNGTKTATCTVTVAAATVPVTGVTLSRTTMTLASGTADMLVATIQPADATIQVVSWSSDNTAVATVENKLFEAQVTAQSIGVATITVTTLDGNKTATCAVTVVGESPVRASRPTFAAGATDYSLAIQADGSLWAWGDNFYGQLGLGDKGNGTHRLVPTRVGADDDWVSVVAGGWHTLALKADGSLWAWGDGSYGQLGLGDNASHSSPARVGMDYDWAVVNAGFNHTVALKADGSLWAWGGGSGGMIGDGTNQTRFSPTSVGAADASWVSVAAGSSHTMAVQTDGSLWAWGGNAYGQLGLGDYGYGTNRLVPTRVGAENGWASVAVGGSGEHTMALKADGGLWAWGNNAYGQLGLGNYTLASVPARVGADNDWAAVSPGRMHMLALKANGSLWACGADYQGQLGLGGIGGFNVPTRVGADYDWAAAAAGENHSLGVKGDGGLWAWGGNGYGSLGDGTETTRNAPVPIGPGYLVPGLVVEE
jgi:alpha-tubulin suppressor-like RCC1 family protein/uncharacterized protein YjdB